MSLNFHVTLTLVSPWDDFLFQIKKPSTASNHLQVKSFTGDSREQRSERPKGHLVRGSELTGTPYAYTKSLKYNNGLPGISRTQDINEK